MEYKFEVERDVLMYAMRYAIGRQTFAPSTVVQNIKHNIHLLDNNNLKMMIRDINWHASYGENSFGMQCDKELWLGFREYLENIIQNREER